MAATPFSHLGALFPPHVSRPYKQFADGPLQLHFFCPDTGPKEPKPAIVFFFGGGWMAGTPQQFFPQCAYLATRGMVAIAAQYRTQQSHGVPPSTCVADAKSAMRWVRRHAAEFEIDPDQILAGGGSAGGHLAAATALVEGFDDPQDDPSIPTRPEALILFNPVIDNGPGGYGHDRVSAYWEAFSPLHNLNATVPPTIFLLGTEDKLIPVTTGRAFRDRVATIGGRCDLHLYPGQAHGFFNFAHRENFIATLAVVDAFLVSLGKLQGPARIVPWLESNVPSE